MNQLIIDTMDSYNEYLKKVSEGSQIIADLIREDRLQEAMKSILEFSNGTMWLIDVNNLLENNGFSNPLYIEKIKEFLNEINVGIERQDFILVADMFEYEIKPFFEECTLYDLSDTNEF